MHDGVTKSIFAHLTPKGMDFPGCREGCENDYQRFGQFGRRVVFRCDNEPSILALLRAVKLAWQCGSTRNVCRGRPAVQRRCRKFGKNVIKGMSDRSSWRSSPPSVLKCRRIMTYQFAIGRDWKTAYEMSVSVVDAAAAITTRRLGPLDSRFEQGGYWGPMDGSNTVKWSCESQNNQMVAPRRTMEWQFVGRSTRQ